MVTAVMRRTSIARRLVALNPILPFVPFADALVLSLANIGEILSIMLGAYAGPRSEAPHNAYFECL